MRPKSPQAVVAIASLACLAIAGGIDRASPAQEPKEVALEAADGVKIKVRMEGPYTAEVPLQIVCYFRHTPEGARRMAGAPVELDKKLGGVIAALRERGEFAGDEMETILIRPPKGSIKAEALLLIGLGDEESLSLGLMERAGRTALREAARLGASRVAFAPLIRDQGNTKLGAGEVERAVVRGVLLAHDTEKRLQGQGLAKGWVLEGWEVEAGPAYFDDTVAGVKQAIAQASDAAKARDKRPYSSKGE